MSAAWQQDAAAPPPVLILAAPGCPGQTLAAALGRHPGAYDLPELNLELAPLTDTFLRDLSGLRSVQMHGLLRALCHLLAGEQSMDAVDMARRWLTRRAHLPTDRLAREIAARLAPRVMVRPVTAALFDPGAALRLRETFARVRMVRLQCHPRRLGQAVMAQGGGAAARILGARARPADGAQPPGASQATAPPDPQELWLMAEQGADGICAGLPQDQIRALRLEDLHADPAAALADLAGWLGLPANAAALAAMQHPQASPFAGTGPFGAHTGGDITPLDRLCPDGDRAAALDGPLPWRSDGAGFRPEIRARAAAMGYA